MTTEVKTEETTPQSAQDVQNATLIFLMEELRNLRSEMNQLRSTPPAVAGRITVLPASNAGSGTGRPRTQGSPHIDTQTGMVYRSKAAAGKALFPEFEGMALKDGRVVKMHGWIFHDIVSLAPGRLIPYNGSKAHGEIDAEYVIEHVDDPEKSEVETAKNETPVAEKPAETTPATEDTVAEEKVEQKPEVTQAQQKPVQAQQGQQKPVQHQHKK